MPVPMPLLIRPLHQDSGVEDEASDAEEEPSEDDEEKEETGCAACGSNGDQDVLLVCDGCEAEYHTFCLDPPLERIPEADKWFCSVCASGDRPAFFLPILSKKDMNVPQAPKVDLILGQKGNKYLVKWELTSYRHLKWVSLSDLGGDDRKATNYTKRQVSFCPPPTRKGNGSR